MVFFHIFRRAVWMPCLMLWRVCRVRRTGLDRPRVWVDVQLCTRRSGIGKIQLKHLDYWGCFCTDHLSFQIEFLLVNREFSHWQCTNKYGGKEGGGGSQNKWSQEQVLFTSTIVPSIIFKPLTEINSDHANMQQVSF